MSSFSEPILPGAEYFQRLADGAPVMIWMAGQDMGCFYFNCAWLEFVGRVLDQEAGNGWAEGVHPEDLERCVSHYVTCFQRRLPFAMSYRLRHHSGEYRWILDRGVPHYLPSGEFLGYFGGCAEMAEQNVISRHANLGASLVSMRAFAREVAGEQGAVARSEESLELAVRRLLFGHEADRLKIEQAAADLKKLAQDMEEFGQIPRGACLSDSP
jgi:PAS domain S-box-containing protein